MRSIRLSFAFLLLATGMAFGADCNSVGYPCMDMNTQIKGSRPPSWGVDSGTANAYVVTTVAPMGSGGVLKPGSSFMFIVVHTNTTASTLNVDSTGVIAVKKFAAGALVDVAAGDLTATQVHIFFYDGSRYQCVTCFTSSTYTLPTQYTKLRCSSGVGDGLNAITAGTYLQSFCYNDSGVTWTITGIKCLTDNSGSSTLNASNGSGTGLLTGAVTCTSSWAAGTQSGTTTIANGDYIKFTFVADGTSLQTSWLVSMTQ